jgi:DNA-binding response OmpR family regulator
MRILLVEDEPAIASFLKRRLEEKCFVVDVEEDGERGSFTARTNEYDLVLLDNMLPKKTGLSVIRDIRARGRDVPILVLSVRGDIEAKVELLNAGADDYLAKPFSFDELLARIGALLRRPPHVAKPILEVGGLSLNEATYEVRRDGADINLTRKEFALLRYLMRNAGTVLSRGMLLEHVWNMDTDPFSNTVEAHIASLRKKVDAPFGKRLVHTVQGRGYRIA